MQQEEEAEDRENDEYGNSKTEKETKKHYEIPSFLDILLQSEFRIIHLEPQLQIDEIQDDRQYVEELLEQCWDPGVSRAFLNQHEEDVGKEFTYGEITSTGVRQLMEDMDLLRTIEEQQSKDPIVFYDLGSGEGKVVAQILLELSYNLQRVVGIELSPARHDIAVHAWSKLKNALEWNSAETMEEKRDNINDACLENDKEGETTKSFLGLDRRRVAQERLRKKLSDNRTERLELSKGDITQVEFSDATHIYASSIFFPENVLRDMSKKIMECKKIKVVAALSDLELLEQEDAMGFCGWEKRVQRLQMSWGGANVRVYTPKSY